MDKIVTPTPWRVEHDTCLIWGACAEGERSMGYPVSNCQMEHRSWSPLRYVEMEANAAFICLAVNSFEPMRRALEWIAKEAGEFGDGAPDAHHAQKVLLNLEAKAKAALASVRKP